jgi:hypothetical protein
MLFFTHHESRLSGGEYSTWYVFAQCLKERLLESHICLPAHVTSSKLLIEFHLSFVFTGLHSNIWMKFCSYLSS